MQYDNIFDKSCFLCGTEFFSDSDLGCKVDFSFFPDSQRNGTHTIICLCGDCADTNADKANKKLKKLYRKNGFMVKDVF